MLSREEVVGVKKNGFDYTYKVVDLIAKRVSAKLAQPCYEDLTPEAELQKYNNWYNDRVNNYGQRDRGEGRPTKKERRNLDKFKKW